LTKFTLPSVLPSPLFSTTSRWLSACIPKECKCIVKQERSCLQRQKRIGIEADRMSLSYV
jgi:hypothetical protein